MFIKDSVFKRMVKSAWKSCDLVVTHYAGYYTVEFGGCVMQVMDKCMSNRIKAIIVELIGDLPDDGEGYCYGNQMEPQSHLDIYDNLFEEFYENEDGRCVGTCIMIRHCNDVHIVMQTKTLDKFMVNKMFAELVDDRQIDESIGECVPGLPVRCGLHMEWGNNVMVLKVPVTKAQYEIDDKVLSISGDISFNPKGLLED